MMILILCIAHVSLVLPGTDLWHLLPLVTAALSGMTLRFPKLSMLRLVTLSASIAVLWNAKSNPDFSFWALGISSGALLIAAL